tara:strand:- start:572 stop:988 length:417 start_codon:yes stop_codon:yes gene_type:complete
MSQYSKTILKCAPYNSTQCNYENSNNNNINTPVDRETDVPPQYRWNNENEYAPRPTYNAGLYSGEPFDGPWGNISVTPTTTNMIHYNLRSANPPPGAIYQYPGTNRLGNNYVAMPGVNYYKDVPKGNEGPFNIKVIEK